MLHEVCVHWTTGRGCSRCAAAGHTPQGCDCSIMRDVQGSEHVFTWPVLAAGGALVLSQLCLDSKHRVSHILGRPLGPLHEGPTPQVSKAISNHAPSLAKQLSGVICLHSCSRVQQHSVATE